jgi:hypothetical protein
LFDFFVCRFLFSPRPFVLSLLFSFSPPRALAPPVSETSGGLVFFASCIQVLQKMKELPMRHVGKHDDDGGCCVCVCSGAAPLQKSDGQFVLSRSPARRDARGKKKKKKSKTCKNEKALSSLYEK